MIPMISSGLNIMVLVPLFVMSSIALFCVNFNFNSRILWVHPSNILTMARPEISSMNEPFTFINFCSLGFKIAQFSENTGTDLFKNFKQQSLKFITPTNLNTFLIPKIGQHFREFLTPKCISQIYDCAHLQLLV